MAEAEGNIVHCECGQSVPQKPVGRPLTGVWNKKQSHQKTVVKYRRKSVGCRQTFNNVNKQLQQPSKAATLTSVAGDGQYDTEVSEFCNQSITTSDISSNSRMKDNPRKRRVKVTWMNQGPLVKYSWSRKKTVVTSGSKQMMMSNFSGQVWQLTLQAVMLMNSRP